MKKLMLVLLPVFAVAGLIVFNAFKIIVMCD